MAVPACTLLVSPARPRARESCACACALWNKKTGLYQYEALSNLSHVTGHGLYAGETFRATGVSRWVQRFVGGFPRQYDYIQENRLIGDRSGLAVTYRALYHAVFAPDGSVKVSIEKYEVVCK
ncbi:MAG: hypothetical protein EXR72_11710 [Myxococcales bacterium]|nr:hypothetical protein [Myxococcales bacterium]